MELMAWFLFIDGSGQDHKESPYEVLADVAIEDENLWDFVKELHDAEISYFGRRYSDGARELKGEKILKRKVFRHARYADEILPNEVPLLARGAAYWLDAVSANPTSLDANGNEAVALSQ